MPIQWVCWIAVAMLTGLGITRLFSFFRPLLALLLIVCHGIPEQQTAALGRAGFESSQVASSVSAEDSRAEVVKATLPSDRPIAALGKGSAAERGAHGTGRGKRMGGSTGELPAGAGHRTPIGRGASDTHSPALTASASSLVQHHVRLQI